MKLINRSNLKKKKRFGASQLDKWKYELIDLRNKGATLEQLQDYLKKKVFGLYYQQSVLVIHQHQLVAEIMEQYYYSYYSFPYSKHLLNEI